jgi:hypothetical protein
VLKWGHIWREIADKKYGYVPPADSRQVQAKTPSEEEKDIAERSRHSDPDHEHEHKDQPGTLLPAPALRSTGRRNTLNTAMPGQQTTGAGAGSGDGGRLSRQNSARSDMPPVEEVLRRTVSLSKASVHGG